MPKPLVRCDGPKTDPATGKAIEQEQCENLVRQTRPSRTGRHYCSARNCQNARAREYQRDRAGRDQVREREHLLLFVHDVAVKPRLQCPSCGLVNALPGWPHRGEQGQPCRGVMHADTEMRRVHIDFFDAVWPTREYAGAPK